MPILHCDMADIEPTASQHRPHRRARTSLSLPREVALLLQGGGALGSFQSGVFERLDELGIDISWVAGISIGAVNAAIIAGNEPHRRLSRLKKFWYTVSGGIPNMILPEIDQIREVAHLGAAATVASFGVPGMFRPRLWPATLMPEGSPGAISFYDSAPLKDMLDSCVDWDLLNDGPVRLSVGAVEVESGNFAYWDTRGPGGNTRIDARHIMASGALPPGLSPIEIDGRWYWDGGIVSNTPLAHVLTHQTEDMLVFQVDLEYFIEIEYH